MGETTTSQRKAEENSLAPTLNGRFFQHARAPRNLGRLDQANGTARGVGTCGDSVEIHLFVRDHTIQQIGQTPEGCVYTVACASAVSHLAQGKSLEQALLLSPEDVAKELGGLPADHAHCAALAVNTLGEAIDDYYQKLWGKKYRKEEVFSHADLRDHLQRMRAEERALGDSATRQAAVPPLRQR